MALILTIFFFIFGIIIGSFLNVVILRFNTGKTLGGRSICFSCSRTLSWYELIPLFSFLAQAGKCRGCKSKISIQYPLVEILMGFIFAAIFIKLQFLFWVASLNFFITFGYIAILFSLLMVIAVYDLRHKIIPDILSFVFGLLAFIGMFLFTGAYFQLHLPSLANFLAGPVMAFPFAFCWLISRGRWMGLGDAKLALGLGWFLGFSLGISALVLSFWIGAVIGILLLVFSKRHGLKTEIPFAPFLVIGTLLTFLFQINFFPFY